MSATVCPFLAIAGEPARRSSIPDRAHACFATKPANPVDLAQQERYCLDPGFTACPAFVAWASREAAQPIDAPATPIIWSGPANEALTPPEAAPPGSLWAAADEGLQPMSAIEEERARLLPLHKRRPLEDELPQPPLKIPGLTTLRSTAAVLLLVGLLFFSLPTIIKGFGGFIGAVTASPTPTIDPNPTPTPTPTPPPTPAPIVHIVKSGETLSQISTQYQVSVAAILGANPTVKDPNSIAVGQELIIPSVVPDVSIPPESEEPATSPSP